MSTGGASSTQQPQYNPSRDGAAVVVTASPTRKKKRAVDYEKLLSQLTKRIEDMTCEPVGEEEKEEKGKLDVVEGGDEKVSISFVKKEYIIPVLDDNRGMGRFAYSSKERAVLLE